MCYFYCKLIFSQTKSAQESCVAPRDCLRVGTEDVTLVPGLTLRKNLVFMPKGNS